ncbi:TraY domain-containing protein [Pelosinus sp. IPA-1]|uniref:TraY domain-containing protein n=1 Tax=Pelosinus sp. IPA-1 TaxID=3029569 RepID=UPI00243618DF|nr:TraY domain-containing protein [Pelosinus sp. IPA-1]GMB01047.1 hypothetical protein PIPA1_38460 [Pelosinus sp. IPA-1]
MSSKLPPITVRIKDDILRAKLQYLADNHDRSLSKEVGLIVKRYVDAYEEKYGTIKLDE